MLYLLGTYAIKLDSKSLCDKSTDAKSATSALAVLDKKRYVVCPEAKKLSPIQNATYKMLSGGDSYMARFLYGNERLVANHMTIMMECNQKPPLAETPTHADARRIRDIPFNAGFRDDPSEWDINTRKVRYGPTDRGILFHNAMFS